VIRQVPHHERKDTLRFAFLQRSGVILHPAGYATLNVGRSPAVAERFKQIGQPLKAA
jgi:hypothetical protein